MDNLQESINRLGMINPIIVTRVDKEEYLIVDGRNRFGCVKTDTIACKVMGEVGIKDIPKSQIRVK